ncbi:MAG: zf-HC2 domain-containing protein [Blastocatellia bacterium]|nr:zf-HC2 domain-containing protein [Blastocatellia bacterium]MCS7157014.1 zf-HC2 domain-containing protein [Blastocatellia bacterium]MCX7752215.1 zf-HC2 domain-containing protein [Blastocatellia bacterium]MDW8167707.1 zf-HC2 domain-containing protein [Acidobacteriota bacterium]MDW8256306.1 zf-HC2 domain-containing protein [Acidobacteriota bacterium]
MMNCQQFEQQISEYLDGTLPEGRAEAFVAHLFSCAACRASLDDVRAALELCRSVEEVEPSPDLDERLRHVLRGAAMSCDAFGELIPNYFDGVLTADEYHLFEAHVRVCSTCRQTLEQVTAVMRLLHDVGAVALPEGLDERLLHAVRTMDRDLRRSQLWQLRRWWAAWRLGWRVPPLSLPLPQWAMALILCAATFGFVSLNLLGESGEGSVRPSIARLFDRATEVRVEGERMVEHLERWRAQVNAFLRAFRSDGERSKDALEQRRPSP